MHNRREEIERNRSPRSLTISLQILYARADKFCFYRNPPSKADEREKGRILNHEEGKVIKIVVPHASHRRWRLQKQQVNATFCGISLLGRRHSAVMVAGRL